MPTLSSEDCVVCNMILGGALLGAGVFIGYKSRRVYDIPQRLLVLNGGIACGALGTARIFNLYPFNKVKFTRQME